MPFKSRRPDLTKEWTKKYDTPKDVPQHIRPQGRKVSHIDKVGTGHLAR